MQEWIDRMALTDLVMQYCRGCDRRDFALVRSLYHDDAIDDHGAFFCGNPDEFVAWMPEVTSRWALTRHSVSNSLFTINGDEAEGEHYIEAWHRSHGPDTKQMIVLGRCLDRYARRDGVWKYTYRKLVIDHGWTVPVDVNSLEVILKGAPNGRADNDDPSFAFPLLAQLSGPMSTRVSELDVTRSDSPDGR